METSNKPEVRVINGYIARKHDKDAGHIYFYLNTEHCEHLIKNHRRKLDLSTLVIGDDAIPRSKVVEIAHAALARMEIYKSSGAEILRAVLKENNITI